MTEKKGHKEGNEARIKNIIAPLRKYKHTGGYCCKVCGNPFRASPPDDVHRFSSVYQCGKFDWIERSCQCAECSNTTTLYWHPRVHKQQDYASREEINRKFSKDNNLGNNTGVNYLQRMVGYLRAGRLVGWIGWDKSKELSLGDTCIIERRNALL